MTNPSLNNPSNRPADVVEKVRLRFEQVFYNFWLTLQGEPTGPEIVYERTPEGSYRLDAVQIAWIGFHIAAQDDAAILLDACTLITEAMDKIGLSPLKYDPHLVLVPAIEKTTLLLRKETLLREQAKADAPLIVEALTFLRTDVIEKLMDPTAANVDVEDHELQLRLLEYKQGQIEGLIAKLKTTP